MYAADVPADPRCARAALSFAPLLALAEDRRRLSWVALCPDKAWRKRYSGIYIVRWLQKSAPRFSSSAGKATHANPAPPEQLARKWRAIVGGSATDVLYVGKGKTMRVRVRQLARFGVGRADNHAGGEWMWQIDGIASAEVVLIACPEGRQVAFENAFLERFEQIHGDYPVANSIGPNGPERWWPGDHQLRTD